MKKLLLNTIAILCISLSVKAQYNYSFQSIAPNNSSVIVLTPQGSNLLHQGSYTIETWVNIIANTGNLFNLIESYGGATGGYALRHDGGFYQFYKLNSGNSYEYIQGFYHPAYTSPKNHVAVTYNASNNELNLYVDGVLEATKTTIMTNPVNQTSMKIGALGDSGGVGGNALFDEVRIWGTARTQTEIQNSMNSCLSGTEQDLLAYYTFDNSDTSSVIDLTNNANNGTIASFGQSSYTAGLFECCTVDFPDAAFKAYLVGNASINTNGDNEIQCDEATAYTGVISCNSMGITDLTGIEAFTNITSLSCYANSLTSLDVSQNTSLTVLKCNANSIGSLDLSTNTSLTQLECNHNQLTSLDLSNNTALTWVFSYSNPLTSLNLANGNNSNITLFNTTNAPNLTCIQVDDVAWANSNWTVSNFNIDATASFSTNCSASLSTNKVSIQDVRVFPNPASSQITIANISLSKVSVIDMSGRTVHTSTTNKINVSALPNGIYVLRIQTDAGLVYSRFVKD